MGKEVVSATPSTKVEWKKLKKKLLVIEPLEVEHDVKTTYGEKDAMRANVWVLTGRDAKGSYLTDEYEDVLIFSGSLQGQLKRKIGKVVGGRLAQGVAKDNQQPPWKLAELNDSDLAKVQGFWAQHQAEIAVTGAAGADDEDEYDESGDDDEADEDEAEEEPGF